MVLAVTATGVVKRDLLPARGAFRRRTLRLRSGAPAARPQVADVRAGILRALVEPDAGDEAVRRWPGTSRPVRRRSCPARRRLPDVAVGGQMLHGQFNDGGVRRREGCRRQRRAGDVVALPAPSADVTR